MLKFLIPVLAFLVLSHASADVASVNENSKHYIVIDLQGDVSGAAAEIYRDLDASYEGEKQTLDLDNGQILIIYREVRAFHKPGTSLYRAQIQLWEGGSSPLAVLRGQIAQGKIQYRERALWPLAKILNGDDDSYNRFHVTQGQYVRCSTLIGTSYESECDISLTNKLDQPVVSQNCEAYVQSLAGITHGPSWGNGEQAVLVVKVRDDLKDKVTSVNFENLSASSTEDKSFRFSLVMGETSRYRLNLETIRNVHGGQTDPVSYTGTILIRFNDGTSIQLAGPNQKPFTIDSSVVTELPDKFEREMSDDKIRFIHEVSSIRKLGPLFNPINCSETAR
jgi:hypothetical protein